MISARFRIVFVACALLTACVHAPRYEGDVRIGDPDSSPRAARTPIDLSPLKVFRSVFAVTGVGPYEQHFTVWYHHIEPAFEELRVRKDPTTGKLHIAVDYGMWGGIGSPPNPPKPPPPDIAPLQRELAEELKARAPGASSWVVEYEGTYRTVSLEEIMPTTLEGTVRRIGWNGSVVLSADADLTHLISPVGEYESGFGIIDAFEPVCWVAYAPPPNENGSKLLIDSFLDAKRDSPEKRALIEATLEAARRLDTNAPGPTIAETARNAGDSLLPPGLVQRVNVGFTIHAWPSAHVAPSRAEHVSFTMPLRVNVLAFGKETATQEAIIGGEHFYFTITLEPKSPFAKDLPAGPRKFEGTLHWHVHDTRGHSIDRDYRAWGNILVDGATAAAPAGLQIPGSSAPSPENDALRAKLAGRGIFSAFEISLGAGLEWDPRDERRD